MLETRIDAFSVYEEKFVSLLDDLKKERNLHNDFKNKMTIELGKIGSA